MIDFKQEASDLFDELVARRRDLHQHPETAFEEVRTSNIVAEELTKLGLEVQRGVGKTGVVAMLEGNGDGPTVLVRADMDALPIQELNERDYVSQTAGKMHACGHDGHTTIALGVAKVLTKHKEKLNGRVKFVFQPAEEIAQGAKAMISDGVLNDPKPDVSLGLHLWNPLPVGQVGVAEGATMAGSSTFTINLEGRGGHGAQPHVTIDPVVCAAQLVIAFQTIVARNVNPEDTAVVSVTQIHTGDAHNVIPQKAMLNGTMRTYKKEVRDLLSRRMEEITAGICQAMGCHYDIEIHHSTIPLYNNPDVTRKLMPMFADLFGEENLRHDARTMGGEDMAFLMDDIPGMFFFVGSANAEKDLAYGHHHPRFDFDEQALPLGVAALSAAVAEYLVSEDER